MKAYLMFKDKNFVLDDNGMYNSIVTLDDLEIESVLKYASDSDALIHNVLKKSLASPLLDLEEIKYRQEVLKDSLDNPEIVRDLYQICVDTLNKIKKYWFGSGSGSLSNTYVSALDHLSYFIEGLKGLREIADKHSDKFKSMGFINLFKDLKEELSNEYLAKVDALVKELNNRDDYLISATLGAHLNGINYTLRHVENDKKYKSTLFSRAPIYKVKEDDNVAKKDLENRKNLALVHAANALGIADNHLDGYFNMLMSELAFYVGNLNLAYELNLAHMPYSIPNVLEMNSYDREWMELYDLALVSKKKKEVTSNSNLAQDIHLHIITGANSGGKTTFLRSFGQATLMGQSGMLVPAKEFKFPIRSGIYTHFKKEEDKKIKSGKLDEELKRISEIIDHIDEYSLILFNESFSSTNEREGSEINNQIVDALISHSHEVFSVSHLYTFASKYFQDKKVEFLVAERKEDGSRSYRILKGMPEKTAYGLDLYNKVFG